MSVKMRSSATCVLILLVATLCMISRAQTYGNADDESENYGNSEETAEEYSGESGEVLNEQ